MRKTGDWSWMKGVLGLTGWKDGPLKRCCFKCEANLTTILCTDIVENALWRMTILTHATFMAGQIAGGGHISELYNFDHFDHKFITIDLMHCGDLGVLLYLLGCIYYDLFRYELKGLVTQPTERLQHLVSLIRQASRVIDDVKDTPIRKLTMKMIKGKGAPKFKLKASQSRKLLECTKHVLRHCFPLETDYQKIRYQCVCNFSEMYGHLKDWCGLQSGVAAASCGRKGLLLMAELQHMDLAWLRHHSRGFFLYKFYPKMPQNTNVTILYSKTLWKKSFATIWSCCSSNTKMRSPKSVKNIADDIFLRDLQPFEPRS